MIFILIIVFVLSCGLTGLIRSATFKYNIMDVPNERSSHQILTPRGGGLSFILIFLTGAFLYFQKTPTSSSMVLSLILSGLSVAVVGFVDDLGHVRARFRLIGHLFSACLCLILLQGLPVIHIFTWTIYPGLLGYLLAALFIAWMINLYNFMDGINGIAAIEAISSCLLMTVIYRFTGYEHLMFLPVLLAVSVSGFLLWNYPVAKIFMGDAGSGFLGLVLSWFTLQAALSHASFLFSWLIVLGVFIVDASLTLLFRIIQGDKIYEAHKSHAYQHATQLLKAHEQVTFIVLLLNSFWLFPIAFLVAMDMLDGILGVGLAYLPLIILAIKLGAGKTIQGLKPAK